MTHKYLLLAGHGGEAFGHYLTAGKRSPEVPPGIYEGVYDREICGLVVPALRGSGIEAEFLNPGPYNIPTTVRTYSLSRTESVVHYGSYYKYETKYPRVELVNEIHLRAGNCILVVLHCNAARGTGWSDANGFRVFHSRNASERSRVLSGYLHSGMFKHTDIGARSIAKKNCSILSKTKPPAVLLEMFFMTNKDDVSNGTSDQGKAAIVRAIHGSIVDFEKEEK